MQKRWVTKTPDPKLQILLSDALHIHPIVAQLLVNRDIKTVQEAKEFLQCDVRLIGDPFLFKGMKKAVERINQAKTNNEKVLVFGDYDVDGVTSSALLYKALTKFGLKVLNHIPHRVNDGYGLNDAIAPWAKEEGVTLLIAVDCGVTAVEEVNTFNNFGIDVIVLDHHEPPEDGLPDAYAIVDPKQKDCQYPFKYFASVGLSAKLIQALTGEIPQDDLDLVAIGTIADIVPLIGENRIFVKEGLPKINKTQKKGLRALLESARIQDKKISPHYIGFILGPRLNAMGRMDSAQKSLDLLLSDDAFEAKTLAQLLESHNTQRQRMQKDIIQEAIDIIEQEVNFKDQKVIVLSKEGWHKGVLGIVASRITEMYYRPAIVISIKDGVGTASARSIEGFHLYDALSHCSEVLENFGGHQGAAGLTIKQEKIDSFREVINRVAHDRLELKTLIPTLNVDCEIPFSSINDELAVIVESMEPFGEGNPVPVFCTRGMTVKSSPNILGKDTLKFWVTDGKRNISAVGFGMAKMAPLVQANQKIDLAYQISIDDWNKEPTVQLKIKDIRTSEE